MRKRGTGTVRLRKDGRWEGRHVVSYDEKGLPKTKNVLAKTKAECVAKLKILQETIEPPKLKRGKADMTFGGWMNFWYEHDSKPILRPTTQATYEEIIRLHVVPALGEILLRDLSTNDLQQFYSQTKSAGRKRMADYYGEGLSDRRVRAIHAVCRTALERAKTEGLIRKNPAIDCKLPPMNSREMQVLTSDELQRFFLQAKEEGYYELFLLELATGLRRGELLALQWDDLNFATGELAINKQVYRVNGKLVVSTPKTKASIRSLVLPQSIRPVLETHRKNTHSRWMFPSPVIDDAPLDPTTVRKKLQRIFDHAQCKRVRFHDLRHTFATNALAGGMDIKTLSTIIGHVSTATTLDVYTHSTEKMQREAARRIDVGFGNDAPTPTPTVVKAPQTAEFQPYKGKIRKAGTGCVSQINDHLWEGRYSPKWIDGKRKICTTYAKTEGECEEQLAALIVETKAELARLKSVF